MRTSKNIRKRTINKKVTILGSSGSPEKGNLIKYKQDDATASYKNVKNYALHMFILSGRILGDLLYTVHPVSMGFGALLKEPSLDKNLRCRKRNHPFDTTRFDVVPTDTIPTHLRPCSSPLLVRNVDGIIISGHRRMLDGRMSTVAGCSTHHHRCV